MLRFKLNLVFRNSLCSKSWKGTKCQVTFMRKLCKEFDELKFHSSRFKNNELYKKSLTLIFALTFYAREFKKKWRWIWSNSGHFFTFSDQKCEISKFFTKQKKIITNIFQVTLTVDDQYKERWTSPSTVNMLASAQVKPIWRKNFCMDWQTSVHTSQITFQETSLTSYNQYLY